MELVTRNYWWPGVTKEVKRYVEGCDQDSTVINSKPTPKTSPVPSHIVPNILTNIIDDKVSTDISAIKHPITSDYSTFNPDSLISLPTLQKLSKWQSLLKRDLFTHDCKSISCYQDHRFLAMTM